MSDKDNTTPESEVKETPEETVNDEQVTEEPTVGSFQEEEKAGKKVPDSIPYDRFQKVNEEKKELETKLAALEEKSEPADDSEVKVLADKLAKIEEKEKREEQNKVLSKGLADALETAPEYKDVINEQVIKQMALNPANKDKTFLQLFDEAYGNAIGGKRTIESTTPRGGANPEKVDFDKASRDNEYLKTVLADPAMKKEYNKGLETRIRL